VPQPRPNDAPAAFPLTGYAAGLALAPLLVNARLCAAALLGTAAATLLLCVRNRGVHRASLRIATIVQLALACGVGVGAHVRAVQLREEQALAALPSDRFVTIEAPRDHDWSPRGNAFLLRVERFNGFEKPLLVYAPFEPPPAGMRTTLRAEGFLRRGESGIWSMSVKSPRLLEYRGTLPRWSPRRWNRALAARLVPLARAHPDEVALVEALALGRSERLTDEVRSGFRRGGTYHLLVFSGLQIALAAGVIAWLLRRAGAPRASDWLLLAFALLAPPFIGGSASVSRASIGIGAYALSRILRRPTSMENLWCVAALARLILAPGDLTDAAFHLTYAGAGALLFMARGRWWLAPLAAELAIVPLTLFHFHQYAIGGSVMTVVMTPLVFAMLVVSAVVFVFPPAIHAITLLHAAAGAMNGASAAGFGFFAAPPAAALAAAGLLSLAAISFPRHRAAAIAAALTIPLLALLATPRASGTELIALDVGQGDALVVRDGARTLLVDGGGEPGERKLLPMLAERGIRHADVIVLTHAHPDHCTGLPAAIENLAPREVWISPRRFRGVCAQTILAACTRSSTPIHIVRDGDRMQLGAIAVSTMLAPRLPRRSPENNSSIVLRLQLERRRALLTGDIERETEWQLAGPAVRADILKVGHHGSRTSSTAPFLDAVAPRLGIISCGRHNLFGHPHPAVLEALESRGIRPLRTDRSGSVTLSFAGGHIYAAREIDTPR
jgi:competence protein ComEC